MEEESVSKRERRIWYAGSLTARAISIFIAVLLGTLSALAINPVNVDVPPIEVPPIEIPEIQMPEMKGWHQSYSGSFDLDWSEFFYIRGEKAIISWTPSNTLEPSAVAKLCEQRGTMDECIGQVTTINAQENRTFDLTIGEIEEGWYSLCWTGGTGAIEKFVEVYLYY